MYRTDFWTLWEKARVGCFKRTIATVSTEVNPKGKGSPHQRTGVHMSLSDLVSSVCMPRSEIAGSYGSSISSF